MFYRFFMSQQVCRVQFVRFSMQKADISYQKPQKILLKFLDFSGLHLSRTFLYNSYALKPNFNSNMHLGSKINLSPCEQIEQGGSKFNGKKKSTHPLIWCQRICLFVCLLQTLTSIISGLAEQHGLIFFQNINAKKPCLKSFLVGR